MKELLPINHNILLDLNSIRGEQRTSGGIIIPDTAREKPHFAKVIAISNIENPEIAVGDTVVFKKYSGTEMEFEGNKYLLIPYDDLIAKIVETEEI